MSGIGDGGHQIAFKFGFVRNYMRWGNSRVASPRSGAVCSDDVWVICSERSHTDRHAGREIVFGIVRRFRPWWNPRRRDRGGLQLHREGLQMVGDVM